MNHGCQMKVRGLLCSAGVLAMAGAMLAVAHKQQKWGWVLTEFKVSICCYDQALTVSVTVATKSVQRTHLHGVFPAKLHASLQHRLFLGLSTNPESHSLASPASLKQLLVLCLTQQPYCLQSKAVCKDQEQTCMLMLTQQHDVATSCDCKHQVQSLVCLYVLPLT